MQKACDSSFAPMVAQIHPRSMGWCMSCHYDICCLDCEEWLGLPTTQTNHAGKRLYEALKHIELWYRVAELASEVDKAGGELELSFDFIQLDTRWIKTHGRHRLAVIDEYSKRWELYHILDTGS
jgi:hypothetical protein